MMYQSNEMKGNQVSQEQVAEIIEAILSGKYSWACVLMLTYLGYQPIHYMPDRTLSRLTKENGFPKQPAKTSNRQGADLPRNAEPVKRLNRLKNLSHLEPVGGRASLLKGGQHSSMEDMQSPFWNTFDIS